jgi:hypothetical protein
MALAKKIKQLFFMVPDKAGQLAAITAALGKSKVNITNICAYGMQGEATFMLTTDSHARAKKALAPLGAEIKEYEIIEAEISNKPGELQKVAKKLSDADISIMYIYGTTSKSRTANVVFTTTDDAKAIKLINKK